MKEKRNEVWVGLGIVWTFVLGYYSFGCATAEEVAVGVVEMEAQQLLGEGVDHLLGTNVDPVTGTRQDIVTDQDLKNGLSSVLEFVAESARISGHMQARDYLLQVSRDITSGRGHPAPNPGPVTPTGGDK